MVWMHPTCLDTDSTFLKIPLSTCKESIALISADVANNFSTVAVVDLYMPECERNFIRYMVRIGAPRFLRALSESDKLDPEKVGEKMMEL